MFVIESAIAKAADVLGIGAALIQQRNLLQTGDEFMYGQKAVSQANECWNKATSLFNLEGAKKVVADFNSKND